MFKRSFIICLFTLLLVACWSGVKAQAVSLRGTMSAVAAYNATHTHEKIYIHTDKFNYNKEDTLWFKAYVFDAKLAATSKSGLMYIEIADANNRVVNRNLVQLHYGIGWGNIALTALRYPEGTYTLRAYTNWMRNFDEHYIYSRQFTIEGAMDEDWMINSRFELTENEGISNIKSDLAFVKSNGSRMFAEELKARITAGKRTLYNTKLTTGVDGTLAFDFDLPEKTSAGEINIALTKKTKRGQDVVFNVPVIINRDEKTDLQFMPEGGHMVSGLLNRVGFKAINEEGKGVDINGGIYNSTGKKVADLNSIHKGMGWFELTPEPGEAYTAKITYRDKPLSSPLPAAIASGMVMRVDNITNKDSIIVILNPSSDVQQAGSYFYLIGQSRNVVCYGAMVNAAKGNMRFSIHRSAFPTGIARFTLLTTLNHPVAERSIYVNHNDQIKVNVLLSKPTYAGRDSVYMEIIATNKGGSPIEGSFSLSVTDDAQARPDTTGDYGLPVRILLADEIKGNIENPRWYFSKGDSIQKASALDALLLTQGWVNYNWTDVFSPKQNTLRYEAEPDFSVKGRVVNAFNKPLEKSNIVLLSTKPVFVTDTLTNEKGEFRFSNLSHYDTVAYNLQAKNKRGRMFNVGVEVDEFTPPVFKTDQKRLIPLYVNIDTSRLKAIKTRQLHNEEEAKITGRQLQQVEIKAKKSVRGSKSLFGPDEADFIMNDEDMKAEGKKTLLDVLRKNVKNFQDFPQYKINFLPVGFRIDGIDPGFYQTVGLSGNRYMTQILTYIDAEDVLGIEIKHGPGGSMVEITTYSGNGLFMKKTPGQYLYRPPVFASTKEFYSPRYVVKKPVVIPDTRATLFWAPNVITSKEGKASVSFYTADKTATYTVDIQGADMEGTVGAGRSKISVVEKTLPKP